jgi:hypothetical protein
MLSRIDAIWALHLDAPQELQHLYLSATPISVLLVAGSTWYSSMTTCHPEMTN